MASWMVVEDEPDLYEMLMAMTETMGVSGVAFTNGEDTVSWIDDVDANRINGDHPELALLDIRLPGEIDGVGVSARLRSSPVLGDMVIILMTAYHFSAKDERSLLRKSRADFLIYKPLPGIKALNQLLQDGLAKRKRRARRRKKDNL
ncbi:MAG: response regulator receiver protein [Chloroflexi bacterium OLB15]|nr:MAG: response regulator receiver protein [Chloroflexi bacterium OLB15]